MAKIHYTVYCDESAKHGPHYSNFYGGVIVSSSDRQAVEQALRDKKEELNFFKELKWTRVTENYLDKYIEFINYYFEFIKSGRLKVRIMFTHNIHKPKNLTADQVDNQYFLLYYQMLKHAFGFKFSNPNNLDRVYISVLLDDLPDTKIKSDKFKEFVSGISNTPPYRDKKVYFPRDQIADVNSQDHCILQGLDIILGAMQFRLNDFHLAKPEGSNRRGKRTIAKEKLYKTMNKHIREIYSGFNIGSSTGKPNGYSDLWTHHYRHWVLVPQDHEYDEGAIK